MSTSNASNTARKLAQNTFFMYFRMAIIMIITLYASRVVLEKLGVVDFGIYNLVGSFVAIFGSLRSLFSNSTQRFLSVDLGMNDLIGLNKTFNHGIYINAFFAILIIVSAELVGIWYFNGHINVDSSRFEAAKLVFHFSIFSAAIMVFNSSFEALCIAHEKMSFYAYVSISESVLSLAIIYLINISEMDKLSFYALLRMGVSLVIFFMYFIYCKAQFAECYLRNCYDWNYLKKMVSFSGWSFLGGMSYTVSQQGLNIVLNIFGGPVVNAARGIAYHVNSAVRQLSDNIVVAIRPYCIMTYAEGNFNRTIGLLFLFTKISFCLQLCIIIPLVFCAQEVLHLWLGTVPDYSVVFVQLVLLNTLIWAAHPAVDLLFMANGNIKWYQIIEGLLFVAPLFFSYVLLSLGFPYYSAFICLIVFSIIDIIAILIVARKILDFPVNKYATAVLFHGIVCILFCLLLFFYSLQFHLFYIKLFFVFVALSVCLSYMGLVCINKKERDQLFALIKKHRKTT